MAAEDMKDISTRGALVAIAIAALVIATVLGMAVFRGTSVVSQQPDKKKYQAVFLTNGQVYFGKLKDLGSAYVTLEDVYYIQQAQGAGQSPNPNAQNNLSLVQLGKEIHGPEKQMQIASNQVIFWENLKDDGKVVDAIKKGVTDQGNQDNPGQGGSNNQGGNQGNQGGNQNR